MLFLSGKGNIQRDFTASAPGDSMMRDLPSGSLGLKLVPRSPQADYDWLVVALEPTSLRIVGLATTDAQGGQSSFSFTNLQENVGLADKSFEFKIPRGVEVVNDSARRLSSRSPPRRRASSALLAGACASRRFVV